MNKTKPEQHVSHRISHHNLHITCTAFDQQQANAVMGLMQAFHQSCKRIFIDVRNISKPGYHVALSFKKALSSCSIAPQQIFFKGSEGFDLAINGNRVLIHTPAQDARPKPKGHVCCGRCQNCHCHSQE